VVTTFTNTKEQRRQFDVWVRGQCRNPHWFSSWILSTGLSPTHSFGNAKTSDDAATIPLLRYKHRFLARRRPVSETSFREVRPSLSALLSPTMYTRRDKIMICRRCLGGPGQCSPLPAHDETSFTGHDGLPKDLITELTMSSGTTIQR
jgi:hypothetical protein